MKQLVSTPTVLAMMNEKLDWTQQLGDAVLAQQADVMDAIQRLRVKAQANGKLETTKQQTVKTTEEADKQVIVIEPASPEMVYVPYYEPAVVYGAWPYPAYPPYYFTPPPGCRGRRDRQRALLGARALPSATRSGTISTGATAISMSTSIGT